MISFDWWDYFHCFHTVIQIVRNQPIIKTTEVFLTLLTPCKALNSRILNSPYNLSVTSNSFCKQSMLDMTAFLEVKILPFLSRAVSKGQFKSPPIMIFSSESKLSFCNKVSRFVKKCVSSVFLFGAYTLIRTTGFSWISALRIMYLPSGSNNFECIL